MLVVLSMLAPAATEASGYSSQRYRVRYSPYAFNYHNSGLIPGAVKYSPHTFNVGSSGLIFEGARYTPYAFNYNNPGLVVDYHLWHTPTCDPHLVCGAAAAHGVTQARRSRAAASRRPTRYASARAEEIRRINATEGSQIIKQQLKSRGIDNVDVNRRLSIRHRTAAIAFILRDRNLVIRYSDPETLESFGAESASNRKVLQRYDQRWETFAKAFEARGGTIYRINTSDSSQIVAALDNCHKLVPDSAKPQPTTLYAKD
jgi:hypothetical protein